MNGNNNNSSNNTSKESNCNCKIRINCPMKGLYNLKNVVYPGINFPKENIKNENKKCIWEFYRRDGN